MKCFRSVIFTLLNNFLKVEFMVKSVNFNSNNHDYYDDCCKCMINSYTKYFKALLKEYYYWLQIYPFKLTNSECHPTKKGFIKLYSLWFNKLF